jgi:drug/metabolite transporter (DMT)-like permease
MTIELGILLAFLCAFATNLGFFFKYRGANEAPSVDIRHPFRSARQLYSSKWFCIGMLIACGAWGFHVAALAMAPMSTVQVVLAGGVVLIAVMADRMFGFTVGRRQWIGIGCTATGLVLLAITLPHTNSAHSSFSDPAMIAFEGGMLLLGGLLIIGPRAGAPQHHHGVMLGGAAGVLFGVSDVAIKALCHQVGTGGALGLVSPWLAVTLIASIGAFYASARGLQDGEAVPVIAVTGTAANIAGIAGGIIVFGDPMPGHAFGIVVQAVAFLLVLSAAALTPAPVRSAGALATA